VILHEILHEIRIQKSQGVILKLDFEKAWRSALGFHVWSAQEENFPPKWSEWMK
jgi:hypothetical protein